MIKQMYSSFSEDIVDSPKLAIDWDIFSRFFLSNTNNFGIVQLMRFWEIPTCAEKKFTKNFKLKLNQMYRYFLFAVVVNAANVSFIDFDACEFPTNTPDRVKWLDLLVIDTQQAFLKYQIQTWITQSTLLGLVRDGATMPWSVDVDAALFSANLSFICNKSGPVRKELESKGYRIYDCIPNFARVCRVRHTPGKPKYINDGSPVEARLALYGASLRPDGFYNVCFSM